MARGRGRPKHEPTDELRAKVEAWAAVLVPRERIARMVGISENSLRKHYAPELERGDLQAEFETKSALFKAIQAAQGWAVIFTCKARYGMSERGPGGKQGSDMVDPASTSDAELQAEFERIVNAEVEARINAKSAAGHAEHESARHGAAASDD